MAWSAMAMAIATTAIETTPPTSLSWDNNLAAPSSLASVERNTTSTSTSTSTSNSNSNDSSTEAVVLPAVVLLPTWDNVNDSRNKTVRKQSDLGA